MEIMDAEGRRMKGRVGDMVYYSWGGKTYARRVRIPGKRPKWETEGMAEGMVESANRLRVTQQFYSQLRVKVSADIWRLAGKAAGKRAHNLFFSLNYGCFGGDWRAELAALRPLFEDARVVAVGEVGLDHHWPVPRQEQLDLFEAQIRLALELDKPVIVHDRQAHEPTYTLLRRYRPRGVLHCYSGSAEDALALAELGFYFGFGGAVTFKGAKRAVKAVQALPAERILLETDCPYMAPEPLRGQRCDSGMIAHTAAFIAGVREMAPEELLALTDANTRRLFRLP